MRDRIAVQKSKYHCNCDSVVCSQCSPVRCHITVFYHQLDRVFHKVMIGIRCFFANHIEMPLKDHRLAVLISCGSVLLHNDIIPFILDHLKSALLCKIHAIVADRLCIVGSSRNLTDFFKKPEHFFRFRLS